MADKAKESVKFLEANTFYPNDDIEEFEVVSITFAIKSNLMSELEALEWSRKVKDVEIEYRITELKKQLK